MPSHWVSFLFLHRWFLSSFPVLWEDWDNPRGGMWILMRVIPVTIETLQLVKGQGAPFILVLMQLVDWNGSLLILADLGCLGVRWPLKRVPGTVFHEAGSKSHSKELEGCLLYKCSASPLSGCQQQNCQSILMLRWVMSCCSFQP